MMCLPAEMAQSGGEWMPSADRIFAGNPVNQPLTVSHMLLIPDHNPESKSLPAWVSSLPRFPIAPVIRPGSPLNQETMAWNAEEAASLMRPQFRTISSVAAPMGPVRIARSSGQFRFTQSHTSMTIRLMNPHDAFQMFWNQRVLVAMNTMAATSATIATMTAPIG